jgi:ABC-type multidrug transport system ATPase subunit
LADPVIQVAGLTKRFGPTTAVDALSFDVARGEILGLLGPNTAGKTTTLREKGYLGRLGME